VNTVGELLATKPRELTREFGMGPVTISLARRAIEPLLGCTWEQGGSLRLLSLRAAVRRKKSRAILVDDALALLQRSDVVFRLWTREMIRSVVHQDSTLRFWRENMIGLRAQGS
jgi:hypothetical protein